MINKPNLRFNNYRNVFDNLLHTQNVKTENPIVSAMILSDSSRTLTVTKESESLYHIKMFCINTGALGFHERVEGKYIKIKDVEQNSDATKFVVCYNDDGVFKFRTFSRD